VKLPVIRERVVSHLLNIDEALAKQFAAKLGLKKLPKPADAAVATREDRDPSPALSIVKKGPQRFEGRKLGIVVSDGTNLVKALKAALAKSDATFEIIAPQVGLKQAMAARRCSMTLSLCFPRPGQWKIFFRSPPHAISSLTLSLIASSSDTSRRLCR